jgi:putative SOS response-associated peptidase YedK
MCSNYRPVTSLDRLLTFFGVERTRNEPPPDVDVYPLGLASFIRLDPDGDPRDTSRPLVAENAVFGLLPEFATELVYGRKTYNARSETVHTLPSFKAAWAAGQRCITPAECIYEPSYETGRSVWWRIAQPGSVPMGVAVIYREWEAPDGWKVAVHHGHAHSERGRPSDHEALPQAERREAHGCRPGPFVIWPVADMPRGRCPALLQAVAWAA